MSGFNPDFEEMTVQHLIDELMKCEDKSLPVKIFHKEEIYDPCLVDLSISDRVDINTDA